MVENLEGILEELTVEQCWSLLGQSDVGRLAVSVNNVPDLFPVNYVLDGESILIRTAPGRKLAAVVLGRGVAFEVDDLNGEQRVGTSVVVTGQAEEIQHMEELHRIDDLNIVPWAAGQKCRYIRINPSLITGRRIRR